MIDYNRISHETLAFLEYAKMKTPEMVFITLINPAEQTVTVYAQKITSAVYAQKITSAVLRREQRYTFNEFLSRRFEEIHKTLMLKF